MPHLAHRTPSSAGRPGALAPDAVLPGAVSALAAGVLGQHLLHLGGHTEGLPALVHALLVVVVAVPLVVLVAGALAIRVRRSVEVEAADGPLAAVVAAGLVGVVAAGTLAAVGVGVGGLYTGGDLPARTVAAGIAGDALLLLPATMVAAGFGRLLPRAVRRPGRHAVAWTALAGFLGSLAVLSPGASAAPTADGPCPAGARQVVYDLAAFQNVIPLNGWGDRMPDGLQYSLKGSDARVGKKDIVANPNLSAPVVIRANVGDCVKVALRNDIGGRRIGIHADGLVQFDPTTSDGARVGNNPDTTVATGQERTYTWYADRVGEAAVLDIANLDDSVLRGSTVQRGLYGAVVVHPKGSTWHDPITGQDLLSGGRAVQSAVFADIHVPGGGNDFRSYAMVFMDENEDIVDRDGEEPTFPATGLPDSTFGINYRSEPLRNRLRAVEEYREGKKITLPSGRSYDPTLAAAGSDADHFCDGYVPELDSVVDDPGAKCVGEEAYLQSWVFGDEGKLTRVVDDPASPAAESPAAPQAESPEADEAESPEAESPEAETDEAESPEAESPEAEGHEAEGPEAETDEAETDEAEEPSTPALAPGEQGPGRVVVTDSDNLIPKAYRGDKIRFHVVHPGASETHPWHQHTQRWLGDPDSPTAADSPRKDVQSVGPGEAFPLEIEGGAGGTQGTVGDTIFHCHLYPHFAQGFWGHLRVFDRLRDGSQTYADGTPIEALKELPDRAGVTPAPTADAPGFPLFVKGDVGQRGYRPPFAVVADTFADQRRPGDAPRTPTPQEAASLPALSKAKPGAAYIDPCPSSAAVRTYRPHAIDKEIVYNSAGWADKQGRMYVEESHKDAVLRGTRQPEPYTIRAKLGECVQVLTTNDLHLDEDPTKPVDTVNRKDGQFMQPSLTTEVSTHVHLVKFDQMASDGTSVGWNYVHAAMPGQTYGYRWYVDTALRTVFFHDHQYANLHQQKGLFAAMNVEPADATWHDPRTGAQTDGVGTVADIRSPSGPDFREITIFHQDRVPMWRGSKGRPGSGPAVDPPPQVDDFGADQGGYALNYRNEPFQIRTSRSADGLKRDPAYVYSSVVHGDPSTPLLRAYSRDPVVIRNVDGAHEEVHTFNLHGHRWLSEPDNVRSTLVDTQTLSLAEYFNYELQAGKPQRRPLSRQATVARAAAGRENGVPEILDGGAGRPGDYLYGSTPLDDQWLGLWGIFRVPQARVPDLQPLPDAPGTPKSRGNPWPAVVPGRGYDNGNVPPVTTCPVDAPLRKYDVTAMTMSVVYNAESGDHDPSGALFAPTADVAALRAGTKKPEPLVLRANAGDCVRVTLRNGLPATGLPGDHRGDVPLPVDVPDFPRGARVSLHAGLVDYDVTRADGAAVGYNHDSTVAPGATRTVDWYAPAVLSGSTINLVDLGDRRGHRHHGLFGALLVEPKGSTWTDPVTRAPAPHGASAVVRPPGAPAYREHVLQWQDGLALRDRSGGTIEPTADVDDQYDRGNRGINYRTERFAPRLASAGIADVFSSAVHGDPATPVLQAYAGERVRLRLLQGSDRGRARTVLLSGHAWHHLPDDPGSRLVSSEGRLLTAEGRTIDITAGAAGPGGRFAGDYLLRDASAVNQVDAGLWGIFRVHSATQPGLPRL